MKSGPQVYTDVFDTFGVQLLENQGCRLIIMDELGFLEKDAKRFEAAVRRCLALDKPVLGAFGPLPAPWVIDAILKSAEVLELDGINNDHKIKYAIELLKN